MPRTVLHDWEKMWEMAACKGESVNLFFTDKLDGVKRLEVNVANYKAKQICATCPLMKQCLQYAMNTDQSFGVWGGKTADERKRLKAAVLILNGR